MSKKHKVSSEQLEITGSTWTQLPLTGKVLDDYKAVDKSTGSVYGIAIDDNGNELDIQKVLQDEVNAKKAKYGKLDPALSDKLQTAGNQEIGVIVWLKDQSKDKTTKKDYAVDLTTDENSPGIQDPEVDTKLDQAKNDKQFNVNAIVDPVLKKMKQKGYKYNVDTNVPVIYAKLKKAHINDIARWAEVDTVYPDAQAESAINMARPTILADIVYSRGITGSGTKVGEIEVGGGINAANTFLAPPIQLDTLNTCLSDHAAAVAGIIKSNRPLYFGISPGASLRIGGSCGGWISELTGAADRAIAWGAPVLTNSWANANADGNLKFEDRYFDTLAWNAPWTTSVIAAGNTGGRVTSPGLSYNSITVGAFDDLNTRNWTNPNDVMASYSGYINGNNLMEKPEVAAPGSNIISLTNTVLYYGMGSGTSYAAPMVTGEIADIMQRNTNLKGWPEAVKAIVMASALHNLEGSSELSGKDGAGGIAVDRADNISRGFNGAWGGKYYPCSSTSPYTLTTMSLTVGVKTRVVMAFSTDPNDLNYNSRPSADLDIQIKNPSGSIIDGSYSSRNTYEIVEFTPAVTGNYQLNLIKFSCTSLKYLGWAWYKGT